MGFRDRFKNAFGVGKSKNSTDNVHEEKTTPVKIRLSSDDVLFVCSSNTVVSPIAEAIFNEFSDDKKAYSAGLNAKAGENAADEAISICKDSGIDLSGHVTANINDFLLDDVGLILTSTVQIRDELKMKWPNLEIYTIIEYSIGYSDSDAPDFLSIKSPSCSLCFIEILEAILNILSDDEEIDGDADELTEDSTNVKSFKYLEDLIHSGSKEIVLDSDIRLDENEMDDFYHGINLGIDDLVIDGNGHSIDACNEIRIFQINEKNITLKNIVLKNAYNVSCGGAINNNGGTLLIENTSFIDNGIHGHENEGGGAINNSDGEIKIKDCIFKGNYNTSSSGGAILNDGDLTIENSLFENNNANHDRENGGAIKNNGSLKINNSIFKNNGSRNGRGAAIDNGGSLTIENSIFEDHYGKFNGGAIFNYGSLRVSSSSFENNHSSRNGGAIYNSGGDLTIENSLFKSNWATNGGSIESDSIKLSINDSKFIENKADGNGGAISTKSSDDDNRNPIPVIKCFFKGNVAVSGGAISNKNLKLNVVNSGFENNSASSNSDNIYNDGFLTLDAIDLGSKPISIVNDAVMYFYEEDTFLNKKIKNNGVFFIHPLLNENHGNFEYLDSLIRSSSREIILDRDIVLDVSNKEYEKYEYGILIESDDLTINGNGHTIDARGLAKIFRIGEGNVSIVDLTFKNAYGVNGSAISNNANLIIKNSRFLNNASRESTYNPGGAVYNEATLAIEKSLFQGNAALGTEYVCGGGAVYNSGVLTVTDSVMTNNRAKKYGGAIVTRWGTSRLDNVSFYENSSKEDGGVIYNFASADTSIKDGKFENNNTSDLIHNEEGNIKIFNSQFMKNERCEAIIFNKDQLRIEGSIFNDNKVSKIILNEKDSDLSISGGEFRDNHSQMQIINKGKQCIISKTKFNNHALGLGEFYNIFNSTYLILKNIKLNEDVKSIFNEGEIILKDSDFDVERFIINNGTVKTNVIPEEGLDFSYLNNMICSNEEKKIVLNEDIIFNEYESDFFEGGIVLDIDDLVIDGNGHIIDGSNSSRIFVITARNILLKNIIFKNGHSNKDYDNPLNNDGGAIRINSMGELNIVDCEFIDNDSEENGGSIVNAGRLTMENTDFTNNNANYGASIINMGKIKLNGGQFFENNANYGGAIYNSNEIIIYGSEFLKNSAISYGGAIYNKDEAVLNANDTTFKENTIITKHALVSGGAIHNDGECTLDRCSFLGNYIYEGRGPSIWTGNGSTMKNDCIFENNEVLDKDEDY